MSNIAAGSPSKNIPQHQRLLQPSLVDAQKDWDPRIKSFSLVFPLKKPTTGLKPLHIYQGQIHIEVTEPVAINHLNLSFEGWERVDFGFKIGASRKPILRSTEDLLQTSGLLVDTIVDRSVFHFTCSMPNVNFPSAMESAICEISYTLTATLVGSFSALLGHSRQSSLAGTTACANNIVPLATAAMPIHMAPMVLPAGVGWLKPLVMRDGVMLAEPVKRRFRKQTVQTAMNICVQVRNHCCTLGEAISVDVDATMLQNDRVLTFVRAAVIEQVALKTCIKDEQALAAIKSFLTSQGPIHTSTVILAERTLNRKVSEIDPSMLTNPSSKDWGTSAPSTDHKKSRAKNSHQPLVGLNGIQNLNIRVPKKEVCTAEGFLLSFSHVLRLTFGLTSRPSSNGHFDTKYTTKDVPLRLVTSKFGDVGRASQAEINKRLSTLTTESDGSAVSEAYGYLLNENSRVIRPAPLESFGDYRSVPAPVILAIADPTSKPYRPVARSLSGSGLTPMTKRTSAVSGISAVSGAASIKSSLHPESPVVGDESGFQFGPLPPIPQQQDALPPLPPLEDQQYIAINDKGTDNKAKEAATPASLETERYLDALDITDTNNSISNDKWSAGNNDDEDVDDDSDNDKFQTARPQRDTLVEGDYATASSQNHASSLQSFHSLQSTNSYNSSDNAHAGQDTPPTKQSSVMSTQQESQGSDTLSVHNSASSLSSRQRNSERLFVNDKRGSAQSQSETIICSPPISQHAIFGDSAPKSRVPELRLIPSIPAIESLDEMTRGMLGRKSSVFVDDFDFSSYWTDCQN
ncbi:hypothetical protein GGI25_005426 [Coemansia spiralis]|uniref:Uncharacterized protein n=2 Tax=Coemansia TaxID=4863 RepID=A0A9W8G4J4_9FUNG|nr:hypothetical protein EDC05_005393 [Coemansia umbellata]KAJ2619606.1 hypothetical protein GGI26_005713 [Coemansia sp. RSA 1358]KAJ2671609.1 hypothetical protein GGI25_005426 [Coemansia spiralis]